MWEMEAQWWCWRIVVACIWVAKVHAGWVSAHGIEGIERSSQVDVGEVEIGVVVANECLLEGLMK